MTRRPYVAILLFSTLPWTTTIRLIGAAVEVHRQIGPGLLESADEECLREELNLRGIEYGRQKAVPVVYKEELECGYRPYRASTGWWRVGLSSNQKLLNRLPPYTKPLFLTYLKLSNEGVRLLINFEVTVV